MADEHLIESAVEEGARIKDPFNLQTLLNRDAQEVKRFNGRHRIIVNLGAQYIPPGSSMIVTQQAQVDMIPVRIMIDPKIAGSISIMDFKIGINSQISFGTGGIPGDFFNAEFIDLELKFDTARTGMNLMLVVKNENEHEPVLFRGAVICEV